MSSTQPTLDEILPTPDADEDDPDQVSVKMQSWSDSRDESGVCRSCGESVPRTIQRTHGDNNGRLAGCPGCVDHVQRWGKADRVARGLSLTTGVRR